MVGTMRALGQPTIKGKKMVAIHEQDSVIDFKKIKHIFSNNTDVMQQVMHGLIITAHQKVPDLDRYYKLAKWDDLEESLSFIHSAYHHVAATIIQETLSKISELVKRRQYSSELRKEIANLNALSKIMIADIEGYLTK